MSIYAQMDQDGNQYPLASNNAWNEFLHWVESLDAKAYPGLAELCEKGAFENFTILSRDLNVALRTGDAGPEEHEIGQRLEAAMLQNPKANVLLITNGITAGKKNERSAHSPGGIQPGK